MKRIIVANSNQCRIFDYHHPAELTLVKEMSLPENKLKNSELTSDKSGRFTASKCAAGTYTPCDTKEVYIDHFARTLAQELEHEYCSHDFDELVMVMPAHMDGLVLQHLNKQVKSSIKRVIKKNIVKLTHHKLLGYLNHHLHKH